MNLLLNLRNENVMKISFSKHIRFWKNLNGNRSYCNIIAIYSTNKYLINLIKRKGNAK